MRRSAEEQVTCGKAVIAMNGLGGDFKFSCVQEESNGACQIAISEGKADIKVTAPFAWRTQSNSVSVMECVCVG